MSNRNSVILCKVTVFVRYVKSLCTTTSMLTKYFHTQISEQKNNPRDIENRLTNHIDKPTIRLLDISIAVITCVLDQARESQLKEHINVCYVLSCHIKLSLRSLVFRLKRDSTSTSGLLRWCLPRLLLYG